MEVYFIRHGETLANKSKTIQGADDVLTEEGVKQVQILAKRLAGIQLDAVFCSPLPRALESAKIIAETHNIPVQVYDSLKEKTNPTSLIGLSSEDERVKEVNVVRKKEQELNVDWVYENEESFSNIKHRALEVLSFLKDCGHERVLVVTHGGLLPHLLSGMIFGDVFTHKEYKSIKRVFKMGNTGISKCTVQKKEDEQVRWNVVSWNDQSHLYV